MMDDTVDRTADYPIIEPCGCRAEDSGEGYNWFYPCDQHKRVSAGEAAESVFGPACPCGKSEGIAWEPPSER